MNADDTKHSPTQQLNEYGPLKMMWKQEPHR